MTTRMFLPTILFGLLFSGETAAHNVRMSPRLSPYLLLTRNDLVRNSTLPVYQMFVRPKLAVRSERRSIIPSTPTTATLSPYLHLMRKTVDPFFPAYQMAVQPSLGSQVVSRSTLPHYPSSTMGRQGLRRQIYIPRGDRYWPTTGIIRSAPSYRTSPDFLLPNSPTWP